MSTQNKTIQNYKHQDSNHWHILRGQINRKNKSRNIKSEGENEDDRKLL